MDECDTAPAVLLPYLSGRSHAATEVDGAFGQRKSLCHKVIREDRPN